MMSNNGQYHRCYSLPTITTTTLRVNVCLRILLSFDIDDDKKKLISIVQHILIIIFCKLSFFESKLETIAMYFFRVNKLSIRNTESESKEKTFLTFLSSRTNVEMAYQGAL